MTELARDMRKTILKMVSRSGAPHIASSLSAVEIINAVFRSVDVKKIKNRNPDRDRIILSKGHAAAALYSAMYHFGLMQKADLDTYYQNRSLLGGHASHFVPYVEHSTGALGHGLPVATGCALGLKADGFDSRVFVITGDGELHEGSNWEAIIFAGHRKLNNLCVLVDRNRYAQTHSPLADFNDIEPLKPKFESFNFQTIEIKDGHDEEAILATIKETRQSQRPVAIICNTIKGKGVSFMENKIIWHYRAPNQADCDKAIVELDKQA